MWCHSKHWSRGQNPPEVSGSAGSSLEIHPRSQSTRRIVMMWNPKVNGDAQTLLMVLCNNHHLHAMMMIQQLFIWMHLSFCEEPLPIRTQLSFLSQTHTASSLAPTSPKTSNPLILRMATTRLGSHDPTCTLCYVEAICKKHLVDHTTDTPEMRPSACWPCLVENTCG